MPAMGLVEEILDATLVNEDGQPTSPRTIFNLQETQDLWRKVISKAPQCISKLVAINGTWCLMSYCIFYHWRALTTMVTIKVPEDILPVCDIFP